MKKIITLVLGLMAFGCSHKTDSPTVKSILLEQLKNTHTNTDWYVPINKAVDGLTADQANWKDSTNNHSIAELVSHLVFWNERILIAFHGNPIPDFDGNNELTFEEFSSAEWSYFISKLDSIQAGWEQAVENASEKQLKEWSTSIANICTHNSYHTGQIIYIRKKNGWWD